MPTFRPMAGHIHVKPDPPPIESAGGIEIPAAYRDNIPPMSGTVIAVGAPDPQSQRHIVAIRAMALREAIAVVDEIAETFRHTAESQMTREELMRVLRCEPKPDRAVQVGDKVVFPDNRGYEVVLGEDTEGATIILRESDVIAVYEHAEEAAA